MRCLLLSDEIISLQKYIDKYKFVSKYYPDAILTNDGFASKKVNQEFTDYSFYQNTWTGLYVQPYCTLDYTQDGKNETIYVYSRPKKNKLIHLTYKRVNGKRVMKFSRFAINQKNHQFREGLLESCRKEMVLFMQKNGDYHFDTTYLDPRLKKLLSFT